jgi:hypothetical protein
MFTLQNTLCDSFIHETNFSLIEDMKNITSLLVNWVPSHIENTSGGKLPIRGKARADRLARLALDQKHLPTNDKTLVRKDILVRNAQLIANIDQLIPAHSYNRGTRRLQRCWCHFEHFF